MNTERAKPSFNEQILAEASEWFVELNEGEADSATRQRFDAWLHLSPEHVRAYLKILPIWEEASGLDLQPARGVKEIVAWAREGDNVIPLAKQRQSPDRDTPRRPKSRRRLVAAVAACLCGAVLFGSWVRTEYRSSYMTGIGEQRVIALSDGSSVELNSRTRLRVRFTDQEREIDLMDGQALFRVAKNAQRPFIVRTANSQVRAVGTAFDIYNKHGGTIVTVVEGQVAVSAPMIDAGNSARASRSERPLADSSNARTAATPKENTEQLDKTGSAFLLVSAGEQLTVAPNSAPHPTHTDVAVATAWTQQRLVFSRASLREVAEEFNRHNQRRLVVKESDLQGFRVSGTFSSADPTSLVRFLRMQPGITVTETSSEIQISRE